MEKVKLILSSYKTTIVLLFVYALMMALGTYIEEVMSTVAAKIIIYYSPAFIFVHLLLITNFLLVMAEKRFIQKRRWALLVIHCALIVILIGAMTTHVFGKEGTVHIREGEKTNVMVSHTPKGMSEHVLPFTVELKEFRMVRYPGSNSPSSYESDLKIYDGNEVKETTVFMNNVFDIKGYRLFQSSYDEDEMGTVLSVNHDMAGMVITYFGYIALLVGFVLMFVSPNSRFRQLGRQLKQVQSSIKVTAVLLLLSIPLSAKDFTSNAAFKALERNAPPVEHAQKFGELPVQLRGRVMPMNSFSSEILRKLYGKDKIGKLTSDQFLISLLSTPEMWVNVEFIKCKNTDIIEKYRLPGNRVSYSQFFDERGNYRLLGDIEIIHHKAVQDWSKYEKDLMKMDEKINIMFLLFNSQIPALYPDANDPGHTWYASGDDLTGVFASEDSLFISRSYRYYLAEVAQSMSSGDWGQTESVLSYIREYQSTNDAGKLINSSKIESEVKYNKQNIFSAVRTAYFVLGFLLLIVSFAALFNEKKWMRGVSLTLTIAIVLSFMYHIYGMGLRWYISGYAPWSNSYETMVYVALVTVLAGLVFVRKSYLTLSLTTIFGGLILFVSGLNWMDPEITTLVPVLKSPWLMIHVAVIVGAYGFFGIGFLLGIVNLVIMIFAGNNRKTQLRIKELSIINNMGLLIGLTLLTIGTFMGAVWANESWGRYWSWDPKETWALITLVIYSIVTHLHLVKGWFSNWSFNFASVMAFASVLMTFFGVNFFLSGLHSYGKNEGVAAMFNYIGIGFLVIILIAVVSFVRSKRNRE